MSSTTDISKEENKASLFAQPYIETEKENVKPEKGGCDGEREDDAISITSDVFSISSDVLSITSDAFYFASDEISIRSDEILFTPAPSKKKMSNICRIVNALKSLRSRHVDQLIYLRGEKKFFGPHSSKPNFFATKIKSTDSPKTSEEKLPTVKKSQSDVSETEEQPKISPKSSAKTSRKRDSVKEATKKTEKYLPPSKIPRISDEPAKTLKKGPASSKGGKTEEVQVQGKSHDEGATKKEVKTTKTKPVNGKPAVKHNEDPVKKHTEDPVKKHNEDSTKKHNEDPLKKHSEDSTKKHNEDYVRKHYEEPLKRRPLSVEKNPLLKSRPPSEKGSEVKKPSSTQGARPISRPTTGPRVSTGKKEQDTETKKKTRKLSSASSNSTENQGERKPSPEKAAITSMKDERYNPEPVVEQVEPTKPKTLEQLEMFEEVQEPPRELSFLERLQQNVKSYFSPRGSETVRMETTVEAKKKVSDGGIHFR